MAATIPTVKAEGDIKMEDVSSPSAASDQFMDDADDDPELDFGESEKPLWLSKLPDYLWEILAKAQDDTEIELGIIRVEGAFDNPDRVSLRLHDTPTFKPVEKEYVLRKQIGPAQRSKKPGQVLLFSEKNKPGYKQRQNVWDMIDEDGNPGQGRSMLFEAGLKDEKKKANKGKFVPYQRRPIPKITALTGTVTHEFDAQPIDNPEHRDLDTKRTMDAFKERERDTIEIKDNIDQIRHLGSAISAAERAQINKVRKISCKLVRTTLTLSSPPQTGDKLPKTTERHVQAKRPYEQIFCRNSQKKLIFNLSATVCNFLKTSASRLTTILKN